MIATPKTKKVPFGDGEAVVKRLPLGKVNEFMESLTDFSKADDLAKAVSVISDISVDDALQSDPEEIARVIGEGMALNNLGKIFGDAIKKALSADEPKETGSAAQ